MCLYAMFVVTLPISIDMPTRIYIAVKEMTSFVPWLANLNIKRNVNVRKQETSLYAARDFRAFRLFLLCMQNKI